MNIRDEAIDAIERFCVIMFPHFYKEDLNRKMFYGEYNSHFLEAFNKIFTYCYLNNIDKVNPDVEICIEAYKQLTEKGIIFSKI